MKITKTGLVLFLLFFVNVFYLVSGIKSLDVAIWISVISIVFSLWNMWKIDEESITLSSAILLYTIFTQFGLILPYYFLGRDVLADYQDYTLRFLHTPYDSFLIKSIVLGNIAILAYEFFRLLGKNNVIGNDNQELKEGNPLVERKMYIAGIFLLVFVLLYFTYYILTGGMNLFGTYSEFRSSSAFTNSLYSYILIFFYVGTVYLASAGNVLEHKFGWGIWILISVLFAITGNKGEFMYALLAVMGMKGVSGYKLKIRQVLLISGMIFIIIPTITSLRNIGIAGNINEVNANLWSAFTEMGMQIRMSVYVLNEIACGDINFLFGKSYIVPIFNIIPGVSVPTATGELKHSFQGYGFSQVIESYLNFGIPGIIMYFGAVGYLLKKWESRINNPIDLAYAGSITCILINATRNYFAFVPGQILIVTIIYFIIKGRKSVFNQN